MERVTTLIEKLQKQLEEKAPVQELLYTVQMLHGELLLQNKDTKESIDSSKVMVMMPAIHLQAAQNGIATTKV